MGALAPFFMFYATKIVLTPLIDDEIESDIMAAQKEVTSAIHFHVIEEKMKLVSHSTASLGDDLLAHTLIFSKP